MGLALFISAMWIMVIAIAAFLVLVVAPVEGVMGEETPRIVVSGFQASIAIGSVLLFIFALNRLKWVYMNRKLLPT